MSSLKRLLALAGLTAMLATLAFAAPAQATKVVGACVISGEAKMQDKQDWMVGVRIVGGKGTFIYSSLGVICVGFSKGAPDAQVMQATANGVYENAVCGTGKAWGTVTNLAGELKYVNLIKGKKFAIHFLGSWPAASTGVFFWHKTKAPKIIDFKDALEQITKPKGSFTKPKNPKNWHPAGVIRLDYPTQKQLDIPRPERNHCTKAMTITGTVFAIEE